MPHIKRNASEIDSLNELRVSFVDFSLIVEVSGEDFAIEYVIVSSLAEQFPTYYLYGGPS